MTKNEALSICLGLNPMMLIKNFKGSSNYTVYHTSNYNNSYLDVNIGEFDNAIDAMEHRDEYIREWFGYDLDYMLNKETDLNIPCTRIGSILVNKNGEVFTRTGKRPSRITKGSFDGFETRLLGSNKIRIRYSWVPYLMNNNGIRYKCNRTGTKYLTAIDNAFILTKEPIDNIEYYNQEN